jgi:thiosulfate/3-mercaptopyruvate sulfurtransferase
MTHADTEFPYPLVTTDWLGRELGAADLKIVDASWRMPGNPPAYEDYLNRRIGDAVFFDLDAVADKTVSLPHMLPAPDEFARAMGALGVSDEDRVVVYDDAGIFSAARVWWTFRAMGHDRVSVLDGGLRKWIGEGRPVTAGAAKPTPAHYDIRNTRPLARGKDDVRSALADDRTVVLDARPAARFSGEAKEPRAGLRSGHMPGAQNLPFGLLLTEGGELKPFNELAALFREREVHGDTPVIASCGSGVTAAVIALALERLGHSAHAVYDGSWTEWGDLSNDPALYPVVAG